MPDREFIHSSADVSSTLLYALDSGLIIFHDEPQSKPEPRIISREEVAYLKEGAFNFVQSDWIFGSFEVITISSGNYKGKYSIQPRTNYTAVTVYFQGERMDRGHRRLGSCVVSYDRNWLQLPQRVLVPAPPEVRQWYNRIIAHLSSGKVIMAGAHRYCVTRSVIDDPDACECLPPFDYIPWGINVLK